MLTALTWHHAPVDRAALHHRAPADFLDHILQGWNRVWNCVGWNIPTCPLSWFRCFCGCSGFLLSHNNARGDVGQWSRWMNFMNLMNIEGQSCASVIKKRSAMLSESSYLVWLLSHVDTIDFNFTVCDSEKKTQTSKSEKWHHMDPTHTRKSL